MTDTVRIMRSRSASWKTISTWYKDLMKVVAEPLDVSVGSRAGGFAKLDLRLEIFTEDSHFNQSKNLDHVDDRIAAQMMTLKPQQQQQKNPRQQQPQVQQPKATPRVAAAAASTAVVRYSYPDDVYAKAVEAMDAHFKHSQGCRSHHIFGTCHSLNGSGRVCKFKHDGTAGQFEPDESLRCAYVPFADRPNNKRKAGK